MGNFIEEIIAADLESGKHKSIITRFPPEPNGYLHIGHAKSICLNYYGTAVKFNGICNLRFDDTNPLKEEEEYVNSIIEDVKWLGWQGEIYYASDYFDVMYECAVKLINKGLAYVDDSSANQISALRGSFLEGGVESACRNRSVEENLRLFYEMRDGVHQDGSMVLRAKIDMQSPNINMRDPVIYRVVKAAHHRQGAKWNIYPMYDFAHPIEDAVENITHSICTLEFEDHRPLYDWVLKHCEFENPPHQYEFARLSISRMIMSKRYLKRLVDTKQVDGWDDPRMPTISGLRRRGYTPSSIRAFCEAIGVSKANSTVDPSQLESCIRAELNLSAPRASAVLEPVELVITNLPDNHSELLDFDINPNLDNKPQRKVEFSNRLFIERSDFEITPPPKYHRLFVGARVRLKSAYIVECTGYETNESGEVVRVLCKLIEGTKSGSDNSGIKVKGVIHWVNANNCVKIKACVYDYLLKSDSDEINPNSKIEYNALAEPYIAKNSGHFQFLRNGYYFKDEKDPNLFHRTVGLKDTFNK